MAPGSDPDAGVERRRGRADRDQVSHGPEPPRY